MRDKHQIIEEPDEVKISRPVLKINETGDSLVEFNALATLSTGVVFSNPKARDKMNKKLAKQSRQLINKTRGSKRYLQQKLRVAKTHKPTSDMRLDATHKATTTY
ncbi:MAG: transposase [Nostoc sp. NMS7]|uniref:transposase n=1 Tax=Nostoc sp. NMS7 TaxID=2815391 RepID=UPI0025E31E7A|nr:transposase [Nostoc sp. NMS7]MBN3950936.1 transposase [Nostoc sp. NMS7]